MATQEQILQLVQLMVPATPQRGSVRVGGSGDGGYVVPDYLEALDGVVSIGVGGDVSFDLWFAERGVPVFQYDHTVSESPVAHERFMFRPVAWAPSDGEATRSLEGMLRENGLAESRNLLLQFDVEGAEWACLAALSEGFLDRFRVIVGAFHGLDRLGEDDHFAAVSRALRLIDATHACTHVHANNCCGIHLVAGVPVPAVIELSFLRRTESTFTASDQPIPGPLDRPNVARDDIVLNAWRSKGDEDILALAVEVAASAAQARTVAEVARKAAEADREAAETARDAAERALDEVRASRSWRLTSGLRAIRARMSRG